MSLSSGLKWSRFALFLTGQSSSSCLMSNFTISSGESDGAGLLLPTTAATGFGLAIPEEINVVAGRTDLLIGVKAGGEEVTIVLFKLWGLEVITL